MSIQLYNTRTRSVETFRPGDPERVTMYLCGPTVYSYVHIGNARGPVVFDVLVRLLRRHYPQVVYARNITDVDDKINAAAADQGVDIGTIAERFTDIYHQDMQRLGVNAPDIEPFATRHIDDIIKTIAALIDKGHAYAAEGHVLFDVTSFPDYGALSGRSLEEMVAGARVDVAPYKRNPADFVLWKPSTQDLPGWDSPWGRGRPGWHIECSVMSAIHLGTTIDIHAGGNDLLFPHHENEVAQSTCAHDGALFARYWLHNGMLSMEGSKMSKSLGNVLQLHALLDEFPPEALRLVLLRAHYRQPLEWSADVVAQATATLDGWYRVLRDTASVGTSSGYIPVPAAIEAALCDDLNTPQALSCLAQLADNCRRNPGPEARSALLAGGLALGLLQAQPEAWFQQGSDSIDATQVEALIAERQQARLQRDFSRADAIRDQLTDMGVEIEDGAEGTRWQVTRNTEPGR